MDILYCSHISAFIHFEYPLKLLYSKEQYFLTSGMQNDLVSQYCITYCYHQL